MAKSGRGGRRRITLYAKGANDRMNAYEVKGNKQFINGKPLLDKPPAGWVEIKGAQTSPIGTTWYSNNKSLFSGQRKIILVKDKDFDSFYKKKVK